VLNGLAGSPWAYRIASELPLEALLWVTTPTIALVLLRLAQNVAIFLLAAAVLRRWGFGERQVLAGMLLLATGFSQAHHMSDLSLNTYSDVLAYLAATWLVLTRRVWWLVPLVVVAVASRETAILVPLLALARPSRQSAKVAIAGVLAGVLTYAAIRGFVGSRPPVYGAPGHVAGWNMVVFNLRWRSLTEISHVVTLAPLGVLWMRRWPAELRRMFWLVVPVWVAAHLAGAVIAEARLFLVPLAVVLIPGFLSAWRPTPDEPDVEPADAVIDLRTVSLSPPREAAAARER
jgi:hypothetical protein